MLRAPVVFLLTIVFSCAAWPADRTADHHLVDDPARFLYSSSAFAHGQRHGYEDGFHQADEDLQMGRPPRDLRKPVSVKQSGFEKSFGDRRRFERGYRAGYVRGYDDSAHDRPFAPLTDAMSLDLGRLLLLAPQDWPDFDRGFEAGYEQKVSHELDADLDKEERSISDQCAASSGGGFAACLGLRWGSDFAKHSGGDAPGDTAASR